jgi:large subunit ribosomal protein L16
MQYTPKQRKFSKSFKGHLLNNSPKILSLKDVYSNSVTLISKDAGRFTPAHLGCINNTIKRSLKKNIKIISKIFPHTPVSGKPLEVRMGKGKGSVDYWAANVFSGTPVFTIFTAESKNYAAVDVLKSLKKKLPVNTTIIYKK